MNQRQFWKELAVVTLSTAMIGAATCGYVRAGLGSDAVALFNEGLSGFAGVSLGTAAWMLNLVMLAIALVLNRKDLGWTTIYNCALCGAFIDLADWALDPILTLSTSLAFRWLLMFGSMALVAGSCALMMRYCKGMTPNDAVTTGVAKRLGCSFRVVRVSLDGLLMVTGFLMGGVVGLGSVVAVFGTGPMIQFFHQFGRKK